MRALRRVRRRLRNWWRYGVWTTCPHRWVLRHLPPRDGAVTTAHYYWACADCGARISFVREMHP
jgi:hypothetical protein